ncbi:MAG: GAF domain-containing protein [Paracoccaceae bacterium]|nr:GAF domain-containing protein [Paracoccaceae bacterium]
MTTVSEPRNSDQIALNDALEREAATRQILQVISRSRDDEKPVFDAILENAARLCKSTMARLHLLNEAGTHHLLAAHWGEVMHTLEIGEAWSMDDPLPIPRSIREARTIQVEDMAETELYRSGDPVTVRMVDEEGLRTGLRVPLIQGDRAFGCIALSRREVRPFTDDEIALVQTFADQAVIAIENVRQFQAVQTANTELETQLQREAAAREVLQVISQSRDDEQPVFDVILENAARLCRSTMARLHLVESDRKHRRIAAHWGEDLRALAIGEKIPMNKGHPISVSILEARVIHIEDISETDLYKGHDPLFRRLVDEEGIRTLLTVPLLQGGQAFGCIALSCRERSPFAKQDIELVETFAAQAVIAIENVHQFQELQARLEREAATREILEVISRSRDDEAPVFQAILENACTLCEAPHGALILRNSEDTHLVIAAANTENSGYVKMLRKNPHSLSDDKSLTVEAVKSMQVRQYRDIEELRDYQSPSDQLKATWQLERMRTLLYVPLMKGDRAIGVLGLYRLEVSEFSDHDIELLKLFADQAVIAIENVRQFKALESLNAELSDRVEEQVGEIERMGRLKRFLPAAVADTVVSQGADKMLSSHRALLGVLFCDIRGFTAFCETAEPEETIDVLQTYHEEMGKLINAHGAGVDHRMGDGVMVLFNDPLPCDDPAGDAVRLAVAMRARMAELCAQWKRLGHRLGFGVGVSLGYATVGMVGFEGRFDYTASGTAINLASRLCDEAEDGEIVLSPRAGVAVEDDFKVETRGAVSLKGIREPMEVFRLIGAAAT